MASVSPPLPAIGPHHQLFITPPDPMLSQVFVFFLPYSGTSSRVDAYVFSACGLAAYNRLTIDPSSQFYTAVEHMPVHRQESEPHRALAFIVAKYFSELTVGVKAHVLATAGISSNTSNLPFNEAHAGQVAAKLVHIEGVTVINEILLGLEERFLKTVDIDVATHDSDVRTKLHNARIVELLGKKMQQPSAKLKRQSSRAKPKPPQQQQHTPNPELVAHQVEELITTEVSYVAKIDAFFQDFILPERRRSTARPDRDPDLKTLETLFPHCLDDILSLNSQFCDDLSSNSGQGLERIAEVCLSHFPKFKEPYTKYIELNPAYSGPLPRLLKGNTTFAKRVESTGEQRLRSLLIEPVQRLPRYSLYIDVIIKNLSSDSPVIEKLNKARSIIEDICALQNGPSTEKASIASKLGSFISGWPSSLKPGRLIEAADCMDIMAPFSETMEQVPTTLLLFPDIIAVVRRTKPTSLRAQGIIAELDRPVSMAANAIRRDVAELQFAGWTNLSNLRLSQSSDGRTLWMLTTKELYDNWDVRIGPIGLRKLVLGTQWEAKAGAFIEEVMKAKLELKSDVSELRMASNGVDLWSSVYTTENYKKEKQRSNILLRIGTNEGSLSQEDKCVEILAFATHMGSGKVRVDIKAVGHIHYTETVSENELMATLSRRLANIFEKHYQPSHAPLTPALVGSYRKLLRSINVQPPAETESKLSKFRAPSPVKLISNLIGSASQTPIMKRSSISESTISLGATPTILERSHSVVYRSEAAEDDIESRMQRITIVEGWGGEEETYHKRLERSFEAFLLGVESTLMNKPDMGKLQNRHKAEEMAVNDLMNTLLKDPGRQAAAKAAPLDILFAAFERFIRTSWKDSMGDITTFHAMMDLQGRQATLFPGDFEDYFKDYLAEMTPQNRRGLKNLIGLLAKVRKHTRTPNDRNIITAAFAELLVEDLADDQHYGSGQFNTLLEYLVKDMNTLFNGEYRQSKRRRGSPTRRMPLLLGEDQLRPYVEEPQEQQQQEQQEESQEKPWTISERVNNLSLSWSKRLSRKPSRNQLPDIFVNDDTEKVHVGGEGVPLGPAGLKRAKSASISSTVSSTSSSLKKRLGLPVHKTFDSGSGDSAPGSTGKASSIWRGLSKRGEKDRPESPSKTGSMSRLGRSNSTDTNDRPSSPQKRPMSRDRPTVNGLNGTPLGGRTSNFGTLESIAGSPAPGTPVGNDSSLTPVASHRKKRRSSLGDLQPLAPDSPAPTFQKPDGTPVKPPTPFGHKPHLKEDKPLPRIVPDKGVAAASPTPRQSFVSQQIAARENASNKNGARDSFSSQSARDSLSSQSIRDSLSSYSIRDSLTSQSSRESTSNNNKSSPNEMFPEIKPLRFSMQSPQKLRERLDKEKKEIAGTEGNLQSELAKIGEEMSQLKTRSRPSVRGSISGGSSGEDIKRISDKVASLESTVKKTFGDISKRYNTLSEDVKSAIASKDEQVKGLDKLYRDLNEENDVLFERFNDELGKVAIALKATDGEKKLMELLKKSMEEQAKLKKENTKLKKENFEFKRRLGLK